MKHVIWAGFRASWSYLFFNLKMPKVILNEMSKEKLRSPGKWLNMNYMSFNATACEETLG